MEEDPPEDALAFFTQLYDDTPKEQASETVSISENEIYFKRQPLTEEQKKHGSYVDENGNLHVKNLSCILDSRTDHHGESRSHHLHRDRQL